MAWSREVLERVQPPCPYPDERPAVWPETPEGNIDFIIVGEAPGKEEVKQGKPFVGRAGGLLREAVKDAGLERVHYTNASLYRPTTSRKDAPPPIKVITAERPRLLLEISMLRPKAVVAAGAVAAQALLGNVARFRGMVKEIELHGEHISVYLTRHPAAILHPPSAGGGGPDFYRDLAEDLGRVAALRIPARNEGGRPEISEGTPDLGARCLAVDTETSGTDVTRADLLCVGVFDGRRAYTFNPQNLLDFAEFLSAYPGEIVGHNSTFDELLLRRYGVPIRFTDDTILEHTSQDERKGSHRLKTLGPVIAEMDTAIDSIWSYTHGGEGEEDEDELGWGAVPSEILTRYCARDAEVTWHLHQKLRESSDERSQCVYGFLKRGYRAFTEGMARGVAVDRGAIAASIEEQRANVQHLSDGFDFPPTSQPQTLAAFRAAGYKVDSVAEEILRGLKGELPEKLLKFREQNKLLTGFLIPLLERSEQDGRVYPIYKLHGTDSGRTSCKGPNLQQVPNSLKHLFTSSPGNVFVGWDFKVHEVRGIAYLSRDVGLCDVLRDSNADPHTYVAERTGLTRDVAKRTVFAVAYGAGIGRLVSTGLTSQQAQEAYEAVQSLLPGLEKWRQQVIDSMYNKGYVETPYYRRRRHFYYIDEKNAHHQERIAVNFLPQSLCGDIALDSAISVYEELGFPPQIFVHDFNAIEVEEKYAEDVWNECKQIASAILPNPYVRFIPEMKPIGRTWADLDAKTGGQ